VQRAVRKLEDQEILIKGKHPRDSQPLDAGERGAVDPTERLIGVLSGNLISARQIPLVNRKKLYLRFAGQDTIPQSATGFDVKRRCKKLQDSIRTKGVVTRGPAASTSSIARPAFS